MREKLTSKWARGTKKEYIMCVTRIAFWFIRILCLLHGSNVAEKWDSAIIETARASNEFFFSSFCVLFIFFLLNVQAHWNLCALYIFLTCVPSKWSRKINSKWINRLDNGEEDIGSTTKKNTPMRHTHTQHYFQIVSGKISFKFDLSTLFFV